MDVAVLKHSAHELVVGKPAGLASELPDDHDHAADSARGLMMRRFPGIAPKLPHRLDRVTRGILLMCLSPESIAFHNANIKAKRWRKHYLARVAPEPGVVASSLLGKHRAFLSEQDGRATIVRAGGKPSWLEILESAPVPGQGDRVHLVIELLTGRFHQIRVMCAALGLPLAGDPLYDPARRDPRELYLEHAVLTYEDFDTRAPSTIFVRDDRDREAVAPVIAARLAALAARNELPA